MLPCSSVAVVPATCTTLPTRTAREYPARLSHFVPEEMFCRLLMTAASINHNQRLEAVGQLFAAAGPGHHHILDARGERIELHDAWLDGEQHAFLQQRFVAFGEEGRLMHIHADAVTEPVAKFLAIAGVLDDFARGSVGLCRRVNPGLECCHTRRLRFHDQVVDPLKFLVRFAKADGAAIIVAEALIDRAKVEQQGYWRFEYSQRFVSASAKDKLVVGAGIVHGGGERFTQRTMPPQLIINFADDIQFGHPVLEIFDHVGKGGFGNLTGLAHYGDFFLAFDDTLPAQDARAGYKRHAGYY